MKKVQFFTIALAVSLFSAAPARAKIDCSIAYEMIFNMRDPQMGSFNLWDTVYGAQESKESFVSAVSLMSGYTLAAGEKTMPKSDTVQLILAEIDHRGRPVWEKTHEVAGLKSVTKILNHEDGSLVVGEVSSGDLSSVWIGFFDLKGEIKSDITWSGKVSLHPEDIVPFKDSPGYLLTANAEDRNGLYTQLYGLDVSGNKVFERAYRPGLDNQLFSLAALSRDRYIGAGVAKDAQGRESGWIAAIDGRGNIVWQRPYIYGAASKFTHMAVYDDNRVIAAGSTLAEGAKYSHGWIMMLNAENGEVIWQRRARSSTAWFARGLMVSGDKILALFDTAMKRDDRQEYARILTLDSRGGMIAERGYFNGSGTHSAQLIEGTSGAPIVVGSSNMVYTRPRTDKEKKAGLKDDEITRGIDAWLVAGEEPSSRPDPCAFINTP